MESIRGRFFRGSTDRYVSERSPLKAELAVNMDPPCRIHVMGLVFRYAFAQKKNQQM